MKTCATCQERKSDSAFPPDGRTTDNLSHVCASCRYGADLAQDEVRELLHLADDDTLTAQHYQRVAQMSEEERALAAAESAVEEDEVGAILAEYAANDALPTEDLEGVDVMAAGGPFPGKGCPPGGAYFDAKFLKRLAENNNRLAKEIGVPAEVKQPRNKIGHDPAQTVLANSGIPADQAPAAGWLTNFRFDETRGKLLADVKRVPAKLAQLIRAGAYPKRSAELRRITSQTDGKRYDVVTGMGWLGARQPAVRTLDEIHALYADDDAATTVIFSDPDAETDGEAVPAPVVVFVQSAGQRPDGSEGAADISPPMATKTKKTEPEKPTLSDDQVVKLAEAFEISEDDEAKRRELVEAKVNEFAAEPEQPPEPEKPPAPEKDEPVAPEGDKTLAELPVEARTEIKVLRKQTEAHERQLAALHEKEIDRELEEAIREGRLAPADLDEWKRDFSENEDFSRKMLAKLPVDEDLKRTFGSDDDGTSDEGSTKAILKSYLVSVGASPKELELLEKAAG